MNYFQMFAESRSIFSTDIVKNKFVTDECIQRWMDAWTHGKRQEKI